MSLLVRSPGVYSLLVGARRPRTRHLGVPVGGPADAAALALANGLVGNPPESTGLELTLAGPTLEAVHPTAVVVFGAPFRLEVKGVARPVGTTFTLEPGDRLAIGGTQAGARGYLAVAGGFERPVVLASRSALEPARAGDLLTCAGSRIEARALPFITSTAEIPYTEPVVLRVLPGPQQDWFTADSFFSQVYEVLPASNRMGVRLAGIPLERRPGELASEAVAPGAIQVTNDGLPVLLGVDGQTIGGYPKIAHVIRADLDRLGQLRPRERVRFVVVSPDQSEGAERERTAFLKTWLGRLQVADRTPRFLTRAEHTEL